MVRRRRAAAAAAASSPPVPVVRPPRVGLLYDERMCAHATPDGEDHPENPERLRAIWRKLDAEGITSRCVVLKAKEAEDKYIASVHSQDHIKLMKEISSRKYNPTRKKIARKYNSIYFNKGSSESAALAAGSIIEVAQKVAAGELTSAVALVRPPGHHAEHDKAMGFCLFNNVAVAANYLLNERPDLGITKILIIDWDIHHGNATQKMFYDDPRVLVFSIHRFDFGDFYPREADACYCFIGEDAGKGYNINVPWEHGKCGDADYIAAWDHILLPVAEAFGPDIILLSAGFDSALEDPLGGCCITPDGYALLLTKLLGFAQGWIVMALEGGYNLRSTANSVFACAKVLLGDKFKFQSTREQPFESTWRIIQAVRNELKTCWPVLSNKRGCNASVTVTSEGLPTCFNQCNPTAPTDIQQGKRAVKAIHRQMIPEARAEDEAETSATQGFKVGHKRGWNISVTATLERPPTCLNHCKPETLTDRRGQRSLNEAIHRQMTPEAGVEAEDEDLAAAEATATQRFLDVEFGSDSSDSDTTPPTPPGGVSHVAKAGGAVRLGPTTASLSATTAAACLSNIKLKIMQIEMARKEETRKMLAQFDEQMLRTEAARQEKVNAYHYYHHHQQQQQFQATLRRGQGNTTFMSSNQFQATCILPPAAPGITPDPASPLPFPLPASVPFFSTPISSQPVVLSMPSGPSPVHTQPPATPSVIPTPPSASQLVRAAVASTAPVQIAQIESAQGSLPTPITITVSATIVYSDGCRLTATASQP